MTALEFRASRTAKVGGWPTGDTALNNSLVRRIGTLNCGHAAFPIIMGVNSPQYTPAELEQFRADNEKGVTVDGRHYTGYEATQMQRRLERAIRKQKRRILVAGNDDTRAVAQTRLQRLRQEYSRFSKAAGLRTEDERLHVAGTKRNELKRLATTSSDYVSKKKATEKPTTDALLPAKLVKGTKSSKRYIHASVETWYPDAKPNSHAVQELQEYTVNGVTYKVDGHNVVHDHTSHEKEIAELLAREVGGEIFIVPRVNNPQKVSTPDYLFHGKGYKKRSLPPSHPI